MVYYHQIARAKNSIKTSKYCSKATSDNFRILINEGILTITVLLILNHFISLGTINPCTNLNSQGFDQFHGLIRGVLPLSQARELHKVGFKILVDGSEIQYNLPVDMVVFFPVCTRGFIHVRWLAGWDF